MLLGGFEQSSLRVMLWESVSSRRPGVGKCPLAGGGYLVRGLILNRRGSVAERRVQTQATLMSSDSVTVPPGLLVRRV
jgi:hypothetical protein